MNRYDRNQPVGDDVGYGRPPASGRFQKGISGNPKGRPRKSKTASASPPPATAPNELEAAMLSEARRTIVVREGGKESELSMAEAVVRAIGVGAAKGGVIHARTFMAQYGQSLMIEAQHKQAERDKRGHQYAYWQDYCVRARAEMAAAEAAGSAPAEMLPHPDDIRFEPATLKIRFLGPIDEEDLLVTQKQLRVRDFLLELILFCGEKNRADKHGRLIRIGLFGLLLRQVTLALPPRLRAISDDVHRKIGERSYSRSQWAEHLREEAAALGLPLSPTVQWKNFRSFSMEELGAEYCGDVLLPKKTSARRKYLRELEAMGIDLRAHGCGGCHAA